MKKIILFIVAALFVLLALAGFYIYSLLYVSNIDDTNPKKYIGTYEMTRISYPEKTILLKRNRLKRAFFDGSTSTHKKIIHLKDNSKQRYENYWTKKGINDSLIREGTWEIKKDTIILHFPDETFQLKIVQMGYSNKFYNMQNLYDCKDRTTIIGKNFVAFKKTD